MYNYMRALENRFNSRPSYEQRQQLGTMRQEICKRQIGAYRLEEKKEPAAAFLCGSRSFTQALDSGHPVQTSFCRGAIRQAFQKVSEV